MLQQIAKHVYIQHVGFIDSKLANTDCNCSVVCCIILFTPAAFHSNMWLCLSLPPLIHAKVIATCHAKACCYRLSSDRPMKISRNLRETSCIRDKHIVVGDLLKSKPQTQLHVNGHTSPSLKTAVHKRLHDQRTVSILYVICRGAQWRTCLNSRC